MDYTNEFIDSLPSVPLEDRKLLPDSPGIYLAVAENNTVLYVGQSIRVRIRWQQHHRFQELKKMGNVRIAWVAVSDPTLLLEIEKALISHFKPPLNGAPVPTTREKKLSLAADIKLRVIPKIHDAFDEYCNRADATKSDILREYIDFLLEHPEIEDLAKETGRSRRELLEDMLKTFKENCLDV